MERRGHSLVRFPKRAVVRLVTGRYRNAWYVAQSSTVGLQVVVAAKQGRRQEPCSTPDHLPSLSKCLRFPAAVLLRSAIQMGNSKTTLRPGSKRRFKRISYFGPTVFKAAHDSACVDVCSGTCLNIERSFWVAVWWRDTLPRSLWSMA